MIRSIMMIGLILGVAGQAQALSCVQPSIQATFADADASADTYMIALGRLMPQPGQRRPAEPANPNHRRPYVLQTTFDGTVAGRGGFAPAERFDVAVEVGCAGPWCGRVPTSEQLLFLRQDGAGYVLEAGACPWFAFEPTVENRADALACLNGGPCRLP